ncbi:NAD(P)/FAD-dependent oxidoreductase [Stackebrandtia nassauensis]|uniref:FAD-dependent pyridine nucleotide-disulfide oxidoreductase n=1 Tax=Stackebrandtia nassauensis (strain DSM 44728 / CIP 108903 / NRRL B-16338 / NBRC 102104 / LLR-40K-21) TaxID=446470 RepID=D3Q3S3_STANL|nr:FAD-dependent oxidoreductase [Stackebrandtia nassauensis]ADD43990.1 FAD-dependent pyridine nucleotide-disulfide oxidoreductase [Stackebrandtia nassauensis DSM 44728]
MSTSTRKHRIVILGAGYAGSITASRLAGHLRRDEVDITVVNAVPDFVERVRLHQLAAGQELAKVPLARVFRGSGIRLRLGWVRGLDTEQRRVTVDTDGGVDAIGYDTLVYALGSQAAVAPVPGVDTHGFSVSTRTEALRLRDRIAATGGTGTLTVVGGGLTGLEVASEMAESHSRLRVRMVTDAELGDWLNPRARAYLRQVFARLGIETVTAKVAEVREDAIVTTDGDVLDSDTTVWTTGFAVPGLATESGLATDADGRIHIDQTMRSASHPDVYAVGDAAVVRGPQGTILRMACGTGAPMALQAADAIAARLSGRRPHRFVFRYIHQNISLGRRDGLIQYVTSDDRPKNTILKGRAAVMYKEMVNGWAVTFARHAGPYLPRPRRRLVAASDRRGQSVDDLGAGELGERLAAHQ